MDKKKPADLDKWTSVFTTISKLQNLPGEEQERLFDELFSTPEIAEPTLKSEDKTASKKARHLKMVGMMEKEGFSVEEIAKVTGLTKD